MSHEKHINVQRNSTNVIDSEFDSMRDRFEAEMRRVEEEMSRLRREFESYTPKVNSQSGTSVHAQSSTSSIQRQQQDRSASYSTTTSQKAHDSGFSDTGAVRPRYDPYLEGIKSPLIRDDSDGKTLRLRFDVSQYLPEEITVKTVDNRLLVHAKHEEKSPNKTVYREYNQEFMLPRGTNPELITSALSMDGVLTVEAPLPYILDQEQRLPIAHK